MTTIQFGLTVYNISTVVSRHGLSVTVCDAFLQYLIWCDYKLEVQEIILVRELGLTCLGKIQFCKV